MSECEVHIHQSIRTCPPSPPPYTHHHPKCIPPSPCVCVCVCLCVCVCVCTVQVCAFMHPNLDDAVLHIHHVVHENTSIVNVGVSLHYGSG